MIWNKYSIQTTEADAELVSSVLMDNDIFDCEITEASAEGVCFVNFYLEFDEESDVKTLHAQKIEDIRAGLKEAEELFGIGKTELSGEIVDSGDWENNWKQYFKPFYVDDVLIKPTWEEIPEDAKYETLIAIDPGLSFGTGLHETTRLCIRGLKKYLKPGDKVTDIGTGSGILSIAAIKFGASHAKAMDIDQAAVDFAKENFNVNEIDEDNYELGAGNILTDTELQREYSQNKADIVVANILADVIEPLTAMADEFLVPGGYYITSGIIDFKEETIKQAVEANTNLELVDIQHDGDWVSIVAKRRK